MHRHQAWERKIHRSRSFCGQGRQTRKGKGEKSTMWSVDKETEPTMTDTKPAERMRERRPRGRRAKASRWKDSLGTRRDNQFTDLK